MGSKEVNGFIFLTGIGTDSRSSERFVLWKNVHVWMDIYAPTVILILP